MPLILTSVARDSRFSNTRINSLEKYSVALKKLRGNKEKSMKKVIWVLSISLFVLLVQNANAGPTALTISDPSCQVPPAMGCPPGSPGLMAPPMDDHSGMPPMGNHTGMPPQ